MLKILLVEDAEDDAFLFQRALDRQNLACLVRTVGDGLEAISYLEGQGTHTDRSRSPLPDLIFTDLKMPRMDGFGVLDWLKNHPKCSMLPIMVFSASQSTADIEKAYRLGANAYLVKPSTLVDLQSVLQAAHDFWKNAKIPAA